MCFYVQAYINSLLFIYVPHVKMAFSNGYSTWDPAYLPPLLFSFGSRTSVEWFGQKCLRGKQRQAEKLRGRPTPPGVSPHACSRHPLTPLPQSRYPQIEMAVSSLKGAREGFWGLSATVSTWAAGLALLICQC